MYCPQCGNAASALGDGSYRCTLCGKIFEVQPDAKITDAGEPGAPKAAARKPWGTVVKCIFVGLVLAAGVSAFWYFSGDGQSTPQDDRPEFATNLDQEDYPEARAPAQPPLLRWDFSKAKVYAYDYAQEMTMTMKSDLAEAGPKDGTERSMKGTGDLLMKSRADKTATMVLKGLKMSMTTASSREPEFTSEAPPMVVQGVREDSTMNIGAGSQESLMKLLFPLPSKPLEVGQSVDVPGQMPFNAAGSLLMVTGRTRITLAKYVTIGGHTCARLECDVDISKIDIPEELKGEYKCSTKGSAVFYFDVEDRCFTSGRLALRMKISIDTPMPKMALKDRQMPPSMPSRMQMAMVSDTLITIRRNRSKEKE